MNKARECIRTRLSGICDKLSQVTNFSHHEQRKALLCLGIPHAISD